MSATLKFVDSANSLSYESTVDPTADGRVLAEMSGGEPVVNGFTVQTSGEVVKNVRRVKISFRKPINIGSTAVPVAGYIQVHAVVAVPTIVDATSETAALEQQHRLSGLLTTVLADSRIFSRVLAGLEPYAPNGESQVTWDNTLSA